MDQVGKTVKKQKVFFGLTSFLYTIIFLGILVALNFISVKHYRRYDVTRTKIFSLSEKSDNILKGLDKDITLIVLYSQNSPLYPKIQNLLSEYKTMTRKIHVEMIDPELDISRTQMMAKKYNIETANRIIIESGDKIKHLTDMDIAEFDFSAMRYGGDPQLKSFKGEQAITSAILSVIEEKKLKIAFIEGHGEKSIATETEKGLSQIKRALERDNYDVTSIKLLGMEKLSKEEADVVAIISPLLKYTEDELLILEDYVRGGGNLFAALDPVYKKGQEDFQTGIESLLEKFGFALFNTIIVDPAKMLPLVSPANLYVDSFEEHDVTKNLENAAVIFYLARSVEILKETKDNAFHVSRLAYTSEHGWGETDILNENFVFDEGKDLKGPVTVAAAGENPETGSKIVVIGDSDFFTNYQIGSVGNGILAMNAFNWMAEKKNLIAIPPRDIISVHTTLSAKQMNIIFVALVIGFPALIFLSGIFVWWKRNRK
ncbi:MAG: GldG family protein [Candidatus Aureabacteria bacterium]|nr:GldG family protein [Candidatus Auribacterota bacterium]